MEIQRSNLKRCFHLQDGNRRDWSITINQWRKLYQRYLCEEKSKQRYLDLAGKKEWSVGSYPGSSAKFIFLFSIWGGWRQTILDRQGLSFVSPPMKKTFKFSFGHQQLPDVGLGGSCAARGARIAPGCVTAWKLRYISYDCSSTVLRCKPANNFFPLPFLPTFLLSDLSCLSFSAPTGFDDWGLVTR